MFEVGILSFEREDFVAPASGQHQRADCRSRAGHDPDPICVTPHSYSILPETPDFD